MPVELQVIRAGEFVRLDAQGTFNLESSLGVLSSLARACHKRGVERALIDIRGASSNLTANDLAALVRGFGDAVVSRFLRLAVLHTGDQNHRARLFAFFSAMNGQKVRAFEDFEQAFDWLSLGDAAEAETTSAESEIPIHRPEDSPDVTPGKTKTGAIIIPLTGTGDDAIAKDCQF
jgi:hypothetical protein